MMREIKPRIFTSEDGRKCLRPGISLCNAEAIGLSSKDLWRMAENGESIRVEEAELCRAYENMEIRAYIKHEEGTCSGKVLKESGEAVWCK